MPSIAQPFVSPVCMTSLSDCRNDDVDDVVSKELEENGGFASNETRQTAHIFR